MLSFLIWRVGILLEGLLLFCGFRSKTLARYPFFFIYIACALADDIVEYVHFYLLGWASYVKWFWFGEFLTLIVGCGIILRFFGACSLPIREPKDSRELAVWPFLEQSRASRLFIHI